MRKIEVIKNQIKEVDKAGSIIETALQGEYDEQFYSEMKKISKDISELSRKLRNKIDMILTEKLSR